VGDKQHVQTGTVTVPNPAVATTVTLGWKPRYVKVFSEENLTWYEHIDTMTAGTSFDTANHDTTQISINAANGITLTANGFTLGTDICDTAADTVQWAAFR